jgi:hypothetical protein
MRCAERHDTLRPRVRQRLQEDAVDDTEDRGIGSDAKRHDGNDKEGESRTPLQRPSGIAKIAEKLSQQAPTPPVATFLAVLRGHERTHDELSSR